MAATEEKLRSSVERSAQSGKSLADDIARAVVAMQFQDSVSQQVGHVVDAIGEIEAGLSKFVTSGTTASARGPVPGTHDLATRLMNRYTMQSERDAHAALFGIEASTTTTPTQSVELF